jgi:hypothetical protein
VSPPNQHVSVDEVGFITGRSKINAWMEYGVASAQMPAIGTSLVKP